VKISQKAEANKNKLEFPVRAFGSWPKSSS